MIQSDCEFVIIKVTDNYILYARCINEDGERIMDSFYQGASSRHVQPLIELLPKRPLTLEVRV